MVRIAVSIVLTILLAGCASPPPVSAGIDAYYKATQTPPRGYARVYIVPAPRVDPLGLTKNFAYMGKILVGKSEEHTEQAGEISHNMYTAFDATPGQLYIKWSPYGSGEMERSQYFNLIGGQTLMIQPIIASKYALFGGAIGALAGSALASALAPDKQFEILDPVQANALIAPRSLSSISPGAQSIVHQGASGSPVSPGVGPASPKEAGGSPPFVQAIGSNDIEGQLEQLKRLKDKGLITKSDYDEKKKHILERMN